MTQNQMIRNTLKMKIKLFIKKYYKNKTKKIKIKYSFCYS